MNTGDPFLFFVEDACSGFPVSFRCDPKKITELSDTGCDAVSSFEYLSRADKNTDPHSRDDRERCSKKSRKLWKELDARNNEFPFFPFDGSTLPDQTVYLFDENSIDSSVNLFDEGFIGEANETDVNDRAARRKTLKDLSGLSSREESTKDSKYRYYGSRKFEDRAVGVGSRANREIPKEHFRVRNKFPANPKEDSKSSRKRSQEGSKSREEPVSKSSRPSSVENETNKNISSATKGRSCEGRSAKLFSRARTASPGRKVLSENRENKKRFTTDPRSDFNRSKSDYSSRPSDSPKIRENFNEIESRRATTDRMETSSIFKVTDEPTVDRDIKSASYLIAEPGFPVKRKPDARTAANRTTNDASDGEIEEKRFRASVSRLPVRVGPRKRTRNPPIVLRRVAKLEENEKFEENHELVEETRDDAHSRQNSARSRTKPRSERPRTVEMIDFEQQKGQSTPHQIETERVSEKARVEQEKPGDERNEAQGRENTKNFESRDRRAQSWNRKLEEAYVRGRNVGLRVFNMAKAAREERRREFARRNSEDFEEPKKNEQRELLDIGVSLVESARRKESRHYPSRYSR